MQIFDANNRLTPESIVEIKKHADMVQCECPTQLLKILDEIRGFQKYTFSCIDKFPADVKTHTWLLESANNLDHMLSNTIAQLARFEGFIDENNNFVPRK
ncbi:MAG: hypothetical protein EOP05_14595 [Proteobacteria bacterium]|nr:MAG: hypothetical protein EOP05_14595 [Pseudomonadota bacterium]